MTKDSIPLVVAKTAALIVALGVLAWFVVSEQRRANPAAEGAGPGLPRSDSAASVGMAPVGAATDASASISASPIESTPLAIPPPADPATFLFSSKTLALDSSASFEEAMFLLGTKSEVSPITIEPTTEDVPAVSPPVFLPSSKSRMLGGLLRPVLTPGASVAPVKPDPHQR